MKFSLRYSLQVWYFKGNSLIGFCVTASQSKNTSITKTGPRQVEYKIRFPGRELFRKHTSAVI